MDGGERDLEADLVLHAEHNRDARPLEPEVAETQYRRRGRLEDPTEPGTLARAPFPADISPLNSTNRLTEIERHALRGAPVILTRHGRPIFALVRIDRAGEALAKSTDESKPLTKLEQDLYEEVFARGEQDIASGNLTDWETIERRVEAALARRRKSRRSTARKATRSSARR